MKLSIYSQYKTSVPFLRWFYPEEKKSSLDSIFNKRSVLPEFILGISLWLSFNSWTQSVQTLGSLVIYFLWAFILVSLFALAIINNKTMTFPDVITKPLTILVLIFQLFVAVYVNDAGILVSSVLGGILVAGIPYVLYQISQGRWIGGGDVKVGIIAGLLLGWKVGLFCLCVMVVLSGLSLLIEYIVNKLSKTQAQVKVPTGVLWVISIVLSVIVGQQLLA